MHCLSASGGPHSCPHVNDEHSRKGGAHGLRSKTDVARGRNRLGTSRGDPTCSPQEQEDADAIRSDGVLCSWRSLCEPCQGICWFGVHRHRMSQAVVQYQKVGEGIRPREVLFQTVLRGGAPRAPLPCWWPPRRTMARQGLSSSLFGCNRSRRVGRFPSGRPPRATLGCLNTRRLGTALWALGPHSFFRARLVSHREPPTVAVPGLKQLTVNKGDELPGPHTRCGGRAALFFGLGRLSQSP